jgi:oxygen-dependent protoporphyrinogen oxidase
MSGARVVVVGGGMAGVTAARELRRRGHDVVIVESASYLGGRVRSETWGDVRFESGAGFITNFYPRTLALIDDLGLAGSLKQMNSSLSMVRRRAPHVVGPASVVNGSVLSLPATLKLVKYLLRALIHSRKLDLHHMHRAATLDRRTVDAGVRGRSHRELLDYFLQPALDGFLYWSPVETSEAILLLILRSGLRLRAMYAMDGGLQQIPAAAAKGIETRLNTEVCEIISRDGGYVVRLGGAHQGEIAADGVVCATTASVVPRIFPSLSETQRSFFQSIRYSSTVSVSYSLRHRAPAATSGFMFPTVEQPKISAVTVLSQYGHCDLPAGTDLVKLFASGSHGRTLCKAADDTIVSTLTEAAVDGGVDLGFGSDPALRLVRRWSEALPVFELGHLRKLQRFYSDEIESGKVVFAGDYLDGPFIEGAVTSGQKAAERLHRRLAAATTAESGRQLGGPAGIRRRIATAAVPRDCR